MTEITIIPATAEHARLIAPKLIGQSICGIWQRMGRTPEQSVLYSIERSTHAWSGFADGEIGAVFGLGAASLVADDAMPWLIPTPLVRHHRIAFLRRSKTLISEALELYPMLSGHVESEFTDSIAWLRWLGFSVGEPKHVSSLGIDLRAFEMRAT